MTSLTAKGLSTRARVLTTARAVLVEHGYEGLVLRAVAARCGMQLGNLQYYFATREALLLAVIEAEGMDDRALIDQALAAPGEPAATLRNIIRELVTRWRGDSAIVYATLNLMSLTSDPFKQLYRQIYADHYASLEGAIGAAAPALTPEERRTRARLLTALIDGAPYQTSVGPRGRYLTRIVEEGCRIALGEHAG